MPTKSRPQIGLVAAIVAVAVFQIPARTYEAIAEYLGDLLTPSGFWLADRYRGFLDRVDDVREPVFSRASDRD